MADSTTARKGALHATLAAVQTSKALFPEAEWGDETTAEEKEIVATLNDIQLEIGTLLDLVDQPKPLTPYLCRWQCEKRFETSQKQHRHESRVHGRVWTASVVTRAR